MLTEAQARTVAASFVTGPFVWPHIQPGCRGLLYAFVFSTRADAPDSTVMKAAWTEAMSWATNRDSNSCERLLHVRG
jgi:hypothetical protein